MAIAFEDKDSPRSLVLDGNKPGCERSYTVVEASDENDAYSAVIAASPDQMQGLNEVLYRQPIKLDFKGEGVGGGVYGASVPYETETNASGSEPPSGEPTTFKLSFDTSGETVKKYGIDPARQTYYMWDTLTVPAPDIRGALGWDGKKAEGVDVVSPGLKLTLSVQYRSEVVDAFAVKEWSRNTGKTNSDPFLGFEAGELLNLGCKGDVTLDTRSLRSVQPVDVSFSFLASENINAPYKEGDVTIQRKGGHQYVDPVFIEHQDDDGKKATRLAYVYISTVYAETSFAALTRVY